MTPVTAVNASSGALEAVYEYEPDELEMMVRAHLLD